MKAPALLRRRSTKIAVDSALLAGFVLEFLSRERSFDADYMVHGTVGLLLIPVVVVHLAGNWSWVRRVAVRRGRDREAKLAMVNATFALSSLLCVVSGIPLWASWSDASVLTGLHAVAGFISIVSMLAHLVSNRRRIRSLFSGAGRQTLS